ncbi:MAG: YkgJ family cysteine cluster protein, partial [Gammaproteobacteria bacterium]
MNCRPGCGACCIALSISSPIPGMPLGKPPGVRCVHLALDYRCRLFGSDQRPRVCEKFSPGHDVCGTSREEAMALIEFL